MFGVGGRRRSRGQPPRTGLARTPPPPRRPAPRFHPAVYSKSKFAYDFTYLDRRRSVALFQPRNWPWLRPRSPISDSDSSTSDSDSPWDSPPEPAVEIIAERPGPPVEYLVQNIGTRWQEWATDPEAAPLQHWLDIPTAAVVPGGAPIPPPAGAVLGGRGRTGRGE